MRNRIFGLVVMLLAGIVSLHANTLVAEGDSAYAAKDYHRAVELYNSARQEYGSNAALLYNLGNAYYQEGDYGHAMVCYLRAHRMNPGSKEINANLRYLRSRVDDANKAEQKGKRLKVTADEPSFFQSVRTAVAVESSTDMWAVLGAGCFILFVGGVALYIFSRNVAARKVGFFGSILFFFASLLFVFFSFMGARAYTSRDEGVITAFKTILKTEPGKEQKEEKGNVLTKGSIVQILSEETDAEGNVTWYKVRLNSDYIGWVEADALEVV